MSCFILVCLTIVQSSEMKSGSGQGEILANILASVEVNNALLG